MAETNAHRRAKRKAAGFRGRTEVPVSGNRRLDALTRRGHRATEVERSGTPAGLRAAAQRLKRSRAPEKVLQVPQWNMNAAARAMRQVGIGGTVKNMGDTKRRRVRPPRT